MRASSPKVVLIVDDSPELARSLGRMVKDDNTIVITAQTGDEAIGYLESHPVDIVVSDVVMPDMDGIQLIKKVGARWPKVKRLLYSGYGDLASVASHRVSLPPCHGFINSCNTEEIASAIRGLAPKGGDGP